MDPIHYSIRINPFNQKIIIIQLLMAIGIPFGLLIVFLIIVNAWEALLFIGLFILLSILLVYLLYGNYSLSYTINKDGILCEPDSKQYRKNKLLNNLTLFMGLFSKNVTVSGIGMLAKSNQRQFYIWKSIKKIDIQKKSIIITNLMNQKMLVAYPFDLEIQIKQAIKLWGKDINHG